jgi:hypothetical protein
MQLLWHCLVNVSFGYLMLIATVRIAQELRLCSSSGLASPSTVPQAAEPRRPKK